MDSMKAFVLVSLCMTNALYTVIRKESVKSESIPTEEVVIVSELIKMLVCVWFIYTNVEKTESGGRGMMKLLWLIQHSCKMLVVALCYLVMNVLSFLCFEYIGAGEFAVYSQLKILTTASFSTLILGSVFSRTKWRALMLLVLGCILVASPAFNDCLSHGSSDSVDSQTPNQTEAPSDIYKKSIGYGMTVASVILSGFVTIYFEKVVKSKTEVITIWERNFQLCFYSIVFCIVMHVYTSATRVANSEQYTAMSNWSALTVVVAVLGAANGLIVAATLKYADSILKVLAQAGAIIISTALGYMFQNEPLDIFVVVGCLVSILSIMNYTFDDSVQPPQKKTLEREDADESSSLLNGGGKV
mmetsp:Transcript_1342/g.2396  ORF Transcript_1342/g.2396 Transcript_1342/m.2396 type:complete len:358 (+) Transcript_1342:52-1125(+)